MIENHYRSLVVLFVIAGIFGIPLACFGDGIVPNNNYKDGVFDVTWGGDKTDQNPINDFAPPAGIQPSKLEFFWTNGETDATGKLKKHPQYGSFEFGNVTDKKVPVRFFAPNDPTIKDWRQIITDGNGNTTDVTGTNIRQESPWAFRPLSELPLIPYRIPDLSPTQDQLTIFTAVNLDLYLLNNPMGFLDGNWETGQTLNSLGINIADGVIPGLEGIFWATTEFAFDPYSLNGFVPIGGAEALLNSDTFQQQHGDIIILAAHEATPIPEPTTFALLAIGIFGLIGYGLVGRDKGFRGYRGGN